MNRQPACVRTIRRLVVATSLVAAAVALAAGIAVGVLHVPPAHAGGSGVACLPTSGPVCTFQFHAGTAFFESAGSCLTIDVQVFAFENFSRSGAGGITDEPSPRSRTTAPIAATGRRITARARSSAATFRSRRATTARP